MGYRFIWHWDKGKFRYQPGYFINPAALCASAVLKKHKAKKERHVLDDHRVPGLVVFTTFFLYPA
jgi:hypothetical protein